VRDGCKIGTSRSSTGISRGSPVVGHINEPRTTDHGRRTTCYMLS
jgi:hypothetical protein